jgi:hypothetical protein
MHAVLCGKSRFRRKKKHNIFVASGGLRFQLSDCSVSRYCRMIAHREIATIPNKFSTRHQVTPTDACRQFFRRVLNIDQPFGTDADDAAGGSNSTPKGLPGEAYYVGFTGCIASFSINGRTVDLVADRDRHNTIAFCDRRPT